jgi:hypothetical protein
MEEAPNDPDLLQEYDQYGVYPPCLSYSLQGSNGANVHQLHKEAHKLLAAQPTHTEIHTHKAVHFLHQKQMEWQQDQWQKEQRHEDRAIVKTLARHGMRVQG